MAFTTKSISSIGSPPDDPTFQMPATLFIPDPAVFPPPYHCFVGTQTPGFGGDGSFGGPSKCFGVGGLVEQGFLCLAFRVRNDDIAQGQTTDGKWPQQQDDCKIAVRYMRPGAEIFSIHGFAVTGFVGILGGSGSAHHALWRALEGTVGDERADAAICFSPVTDYSNRNNASGPFIQKTSFYADELDTDLVALRAKSPIALTLSSASPVLHYNGDNESMPYSQLTDFTDDMAAAGAVGYTPIANTSQPLNRQHSFAIWDYVKADVNAWAVARAAEFLGQEPPPEPEPTGRVKVTAVITALAPGVTYTLNVGAHDTLTNLDGPISTFDFISDRADTGGVGKEAPVGVYALVDAVEGVITGNIATRAWHNFAYVDGATLPTSWKALNPTTRGSYDWSQTDAFLASLFDSGKMGGIAVSAGIKAPSWIYSGQHSVNAITVSQPNFGSVPIPWDPNYLGVIKRFIIDMSLKYDTHPNLSYIVVGGMGQLLDTILVQVASEYTNLNNLAVAAGYADAITGWRQTAVGILDTWSKAFKTTTVYLALNLPVPAANGGLVGIDEFVRSSIQHYKSRLGIMTLQLDGLTATDSNLSLNSIIEDAHQSPRAYRFLWDSTNPACDPSQLGTYDPETGLQNAANAGIALGVQMEELYESDVLTTTGSYPASITAIQTDLTNNAV